MAMIRVVHPSLCLSACHTPISPKLSEIGLSLLINSNRKCRFVVQNVQSDSRTQVHTFRLVVRQSLRGGHFTVKTLTAYWKRHDSARSLQHSLLKVIMLRSN